MKGPARADHRISFLYAAFALCLFLLIGLAFATTRPGLVDYAPYLSFSPDKDGVKGLRLLMERRDTEVAEWRLAPERLPEAEGQLFVTVEPVGMTAESAERLRAWAALGNDVVVFGPAYELLGDETTIAYVDPDEATGEVTVFGQGGTAIRSEKAVVQGERRFVPASAAAAARIGDAAGVLAVRAAVGGGSITAALPAEWLRNDTILEERHFELVWMLLGGDSLAGRTVYFDEYHHGYSVSPGIGQVYPAWLLAALLQGAIAGVVWLWRRGKRFGPAYTPRAFLVRRGDETLLAVAGWHKRGRLTVEALDATVLRLRRTLQTRAGIPADAGAAALVDAAERELGERLRSPSALRAALARWEAQRRTIAAGGKPEYGEKTWLADSVALAEALNLLEEDR
ncbi:DUF4350 domain-containing protein [Paenibacillus sp.]|uniref:DUF4350 domain-containing protein n=1 Tax=Paenibacillus sp. TaxID=58172 RepID=UPI0028127F68|nr:DUF4350 domain-containing protein [Paenibacillus sp.]